MPIMERIFRKRINLPSLPPFKFDKAIMEESFQKFRSATSEITQAAQGAAEVLEEQLQRIRACFQALNSASDGIAILDSNGKIYFCNDSFTSMFEKDCYKEIVGKPFNKVVKMAAFEAMWTDVIHNKTWCGECCDKYTLAAVPTRNGHPVPLYIICTFKLKGDK